jgi:hypothetical protein
MKPFYRDIRWDLGQLGSVTIVFPDPIPLAELGELEEVVTLWLRALRRRSEEVASMTIPDAHDDAGTSDEAAETSDGAA